MKHPVTNIALDSSPHHYRAALSCKYRGARYHIWLTRDTWNPSPAVLYKNTDAPSRFGKRNPTLYLEFEGATGRVLVPAMMAALPGLIQEFEARMQAAKAAEDAKLAEGARQNRITKAAPEMHALLLRLREHVEALDGVSVEAEKLVDDYRALLAKVEG